MWFYKKKYFFTKLYQYYRIIVELIIIYYDYVFVEITVSICVSLATAVTAKEIVFFFGPPGTPPAPESYTKTQRKNIIIFEYYYKKQLRVPHVTCRGHEIHICIEKPISKAATL